MGGWFFSFTKSFHYVSACFWLLISSYFVNIKILNSTTVNVTFWDAFAELFADTLDGDFEYPLIIIIGCGRITEWQGMA